MNIALLTTWASACGIAEYSKHLCSEFEEQQHNILLLNNKLNIHTPKNCTVPKQIFSQEMQKKITEERKLGAFVGAKVFGVYWWNEPSEFDADGAELSWALFEQQYGPIDALIVQYQSSLYEPEGFNKFMGRVKCKKIVARHDSSINPKHDFSVFNWSITHRPMNETPYNPLCNTIVPFPTVETTPTVFSFGMGGRNDYQFISDACHEIGVDFYHHDGREHGWWDEEKLFNEMNNADAIVLWYNEVGIEGQSSALRTAISSMRPVIVNDVGWFKDAPSFVRKVKTKDELQIVLDEILHIGYIRKNSYANCAKRYLEIINEIKKD